MTQIVGSVLVRNEDLFVEQSIRNVAEFCDRIHAVDHVSSDRTWEILRALAVELDHLEVRRSRRSATAHRLLAPYAGSDTWVIGVDGDELYDPAGLARLRRNLLGGAHADVFRVKAHVLNCDEVDTSAGTASGWLAPPSRPVTKLPSNPGRRAPTRCRRETSCSEPASTGSRAGIWRTGRPGTPIRCAACTSASCGARALTAATRG